MIPLPQWRALARLLRVAGVVALAGYGLLALALLTGVWAGLVERALVAVCQLWLAVLAVNLIRTSGAGDG